MFSTKSFRSVALILTIIAISITVARANWLGDLYDSVFARRQRSKNRCRPNHLADASAML